MWQFAMQHYWVFSIVTLASIYFVCKALANMVQWVAVATITRGLIANGCTMTEIKEQIDQIRKV